MRKLFGILVLTAVVFALQAQDYEENGANSRTMIFLTEPLSAEAIDDFDIDMEIAINNLEEEKAAAEEIAALEEIFATEAQESIAPVTEVVSAEETAAVQPKVEEEVVIQFTESLLVEELSYEAITMEQTAKDGLPQIVFVLDENALITCRFINTNEEKTIEILSLEGNQVFEIHTKVEQNYISIRGNKLKKGIYIFRVLSSETKTPLFSKAFVIG
jgi:hypothetical protein